MSKAKSSGTGKSPAGGAGPPAEGVSSRSFGAQGRRATINDIARLANVSKKTVSRVINQSPFVKDETRAKIDAVIQKIGYAPDPQARGLAFRRSFLVGLIYDTPNAQYIVDIQDGVLEALRGSGFELVVHACTGVGEDFVPGVRRFVERQKLHGVILLPPLSENPAVARVLEEIDCQYVRIASVRLDNSSRMIVANDREATAQVAEHLAALGHRRIGLITGPVQVGSTQERLSGFVDALEKRGIRIPADLIVAGAYTFESGIACAQTLLARHPRPTAIFASNDEMAAGVYHAAHRMKIAIPEELSVAGFDDTPTAARLTPPLTSIRLPIREMGRLAAAKLIAPKGQDDPEAAAASRMSLDLVVRESTRAPK